MFALGFSVGGNRLALALGKCMELKYKITAAACIEPPLVFKEATSNIKNIWGGFLNRRAG